MTKPTDKKINVYLDFVSSGGDAGEVFEGVCPVCHSTIRVATCQWWKEVCLCNRAWNLRIFAAGKLLEE